MIQSPAQTACIATELGEIHGTNEGPATAAAFACEALDRGYRVTVGLNTEEERLDRYMASGGFADRGGILATRLPGRTRQHRHG